MSHQRSILAPVPALARGLVFDMTTRADAKSTLARIGDRVSPAGSAIGIGLPFVRALGANVPGLRAFPAMCGPGFAFPSTQGALWAYVLGADAGDIHDRTRAIVDALGDGFALSEETQCFKYKDSRDLSGYVDGTENPQDERAVAAAIVSGGARGMNGSSFVAVQRWVHDLAGFARRPQDERDRVIGRKLDTNEEMADAPASAHVKRAAQESFDPPAFMVRRSMPWSNAKDAGLYFVAYGESLDRFERVLSRMSGAEDGVTDALLGMSRAVSGGYYWCPPVRDGKLDFSALAES
jgi:putative iron-dependent peroxidase